MGGLLSTKVKVDLPTVYRVESDTLRYMANVLQAAMDKAFQAILAALRMALNKLRGLILGTSLIVYCCLTLTLMGPLFARAFSCIPSRDWCVSHGTTWAHTLAKPPPLCQFGAVPGVAVQPGVPPRHREPGVLLP